MWPAGTGGQACVYSRWTKIELDDLHKRLEEKGSERDGKRVGDKLKKGGWKPVFCDSGVSGITAESLPLDDLKAIVVKVITGVPCSEMLTGSGVILRPQTHSQSIQS